MSGDHHHCPRCGDDMCEGCGCVRITLPLPPKQLNPNGRFHWRAKLKPKQNYRLIAMLCARTAMRRGMEPLQSAIIQIAWYARTKSRKDPDNIIACMKSAIDGLEDAGLLANDRDVAYLPPIREKDRDNPRVELTITPNGAKS